MMMNLDQSILGYKMNPYAGIREARILPFLGKAITNLMAITQPLLFVFLSSSKFVNII